MSSLQDLLTRLDAATNPDEWEREYARHSFEMTRSRAHDVFVSGRAYARWFGFRFDAGRPGSPLPEREAAFRALSGRHGTPRDAYRVFFALPPFPPDTPPEVILGLLNNAALCATKSGTLLCHTLVACFGLAAIYFEKPGQAFTLYDIAAKSGRDESLKPLRIFEPLRNHQLIANPWVREATRAIWSGLRIPALPRLPVHVSETTECSLEETIEQLRGVQCYELVDFFRSREWQQQQEKSRRWREEPLIRELKLAAMSGSSDPPRLETVPDWFPEWAETLINGDDAHLARLAGLILAKVPEHGALATVMLLRSALAVDLEVVAKCLPLGGQQFFQELLIAREHLPSHVADALVATMLPKHMRKDESFIVLVQHVDLIRELRDVGVESIAGLTTMIYEMLSDQKLEIERAGSQISTLTRDVRCLAAQLETRGQRLSGADLEKSIEVIAVPELTDGFIDEAANNSSMSLLPLERLLLLLVLVRAVRNSGHASVWLAPFTAMAADELYLSEHPDLADLRLRLLDEAIASARPTFAVAELLFKRANTRRGSTRSTRHSSLAVLSDLRRAVECARVEGNLPVFAKSSALWLVVLVENQLGDVEDISKELAEAKENVATAFAFALPEFERAVLHRACAVAEMDTNWNTAIEHYKSAIDLLGHQEPLRDQIAHGHVSALIRANRIEEAINCGSEYLAQTRSGGYEAGLLHMVLGEAVGRSGQLLGAKEHFETALKLVRGHEINSEARARLFLAHLGVSLNDNELVEDHLVFLRDHHSQLDPPTQRDIEKLEGMLSQKSEGVQEKQYLDRSAPKNNAYTLPSESLDVAHGEFEIAMRETSADGLKEKAEEVWSRVRQTIGQTITDSASREREAWMAMRIAHHLAYIYAESSHGTQIPDVAFVLEDGNAADVERWLARAYEPARRPLRARLARPPEVSAATWDGWRRALYSSDPRIISNQLEQLRQEVPGFLLEDPSNEVTWKWLAARPGSIAIAANLWEPTSLALVMRVNDEGERLTSVIGLEMPHRPTPLEKDLEKRGGRLTLKEVEHHNDSAEWLQKTLVRPIEEFTERPPTTVLWCPGPGLRTIAPAAIWGATPVATTTSFSLPELRNAPGRRRSSLVVLADPGPSANSLDLREQGLSAMRKLEKLASERGPVRVLGSVGGRFGRALLGDSKEVRDTPASATDIVKEASEHEIIIMIAHGEVPSFEAAALLCLNGTGEIDRLSIAQLSQAPDAFAGATVILLSCESGRMTDSIIEPGGVAGTLLSAGARYIIAPLWRVGLETAEKVGQGILEGIMSGEEPWSVLARTTLTIETNSPFLGSPSPEHFDRKAEESIKRVENQGFVVWVG